MKNSAKVTMYGVDADEERRAHHRGHAPTRRASRLVTGTNCGSAKTRLLILHSCILTYVIINIVDLYKAMSDDL